MNWKQRYSNRILPELQDEDRVKHLILHHYENGDSIKEVFYTHHPHGINYRMMSDGELNQHPEFKKFIKEWHDGINHPEWGVEHDHA